MTLKNAFFVSCCWLGYLNINISILEVGSLIIVRIGDQQYPFTFGWLGYLIWIYLFDHKVLVSLSLWYGMLATKYRNFRQTNGKKESNTDQKNNFNYREMLTNVFRTFKNSFKESFYGKKKQLMFWYFFYFP